MGLMTHAGAIECLCVATHVPMPVDIEVHHIWPRADTGPDTPENRISICPTAHSAVHWLLLRYKRANGTPAWEDRRRLNPYLRALADRGWRSIVAGELVA